MYSVVEPDLYDTGMDDDAVLQLLATPNLNQLDTLIVAICFDTKGSTKSLLWDRFDKHRLRPRFIE